MQLPSVAPLDPALCQAIQRRQDDLTKPRGSLGRLERLANRLAWIAGTPTPPDPAAFLLTFAGDHGIAARGVSAYPQEVTAQMVANLARGGAASSVFCRTFGVEQRVINVGVSSPCDFPGVRQRCVMQGTADPLVGPAMSRGQAEACVNVGIDEVTQLPPSPFALLCVGEMGIGNSAVAAMLACVLGDLSPDDAVGPGTGVSGEALANKRRTVVQVIANRNPEPADPIGVLAAVGGCELAAMAGAMIAGASRGWCVVVDGYIAGASALVAISLCPQVREYLVWSHRSAEPGAEKLLTRLGVTPVLELDMRLGEGSGAVLAVPMLRAACAMMREMATFSSAGVSREG